MSGHHLETQREVEYDDHSVSENDLRNGVDTVP